MATSFVQLCEQLGCAVSGGDTEIAGVAHDSRQCVPGTLFVACRGASPGSADGHRFVEAAIGNGASAVIGERFDRPPPVPYAVVADSRLALARSAEIVAGHPSSSLQLAGVTGTNGKTTVIHMVAAAFENCGIPCGRLGTLGVHTPRRDYQWAHTTPEAPQLSQALAGMVADGARAAALEVSSHALALRRVDGLRFSVAAFTNLSPEHLDFHADMEDYYAAKRRLFVELLPATARAVVFTGNPTGKRLAAELGERALCVGIGTGAELEVAARKVVYSARGTRASVEIAGQSFELNLRHVGTFNLENALVALGVAHGLGLPLAAAVAGIGKCEPVRGRLERIDVTGAPATFVDYGHTPDGLARALDTIREFASGRVVVVFGCGGDRDPHKRGQMGAVAAERADVVFVTDDNPRSEPGQQIVDAIVAGARGVANPRASRIEVERDRRRAIETAVAEAGDQDVVLIAGKGHEEQQIVGSAAVPFSDQRVAREALAARVS
ncbi:MAG: UDP-N-acetylmuramoyl-L-alanyl-D-glutamate--2,6-diaminopimelate ligase [Deltaproteobacteria bacterium]|nr:UDP-N-acetylmuramoyl-L-alanyl-D-glutamate--2,6-diaminopimelate ligase [Deltaproteobacteria bacterium]